jgi:hypothetical protein
MAGYQLSVNLTDEQQQFLRDNVNSMTVVELSKAMNLSESKLHQTIRLMDLLGTKGKVETKEGFFNVYEFENWIM